MFTRRRGFAPIILLALPLIVSAVMAQNRPANPILKSGKYAVELRLPAEGLYAGEETDVEFRVTDTSQDDPVQGAPPIVNARISAGVTMPSMPSMPESKPKTHTEGVPGDYGVLLFFPHGGDYLVTITISPSADKPFTVSFKIPVNDALPEGKRKPKPQPFTLEVKSDPAQPRPGQPVNLNIVVRSRDTKQPVTEFDMEHERLMHFIVVSRDLAQFSHEHPELGKNGTFSLKYTFPTAGEYRLFADCAPKGAGGQVLMQPIRVSGAVPASAPSLKPSTPVDVVAGIKVALKNEVSQLASGKSLPLTFTLADEKSGAPVTDIQPWLGAAAHLILIHEDATTFVHSHPDESDPANGKNGTLTFLGRFPKAGVYRGWLQFQRAGQVNTATFVVAVGGTSSDAMATVPNLVTVLPANFACMHCGLPVTIKRQTDWAKKCPVCKCGKPASECRPSKA